MDINYRAIALTWQNDSDTLDKMGWDIVSESLSECVTLDDLRDSWRHYKRAMEAAEAGSDEQRFFAWAMCACEATAKRWAGPPDTF